MCEMVDPTPQFWAGSTRDLNNWFGDGSWDMMIGELFHEQLVMEIETNMSAEEQKKYWVHGEIQPCEAAGVEEWF